MLEGGFQKHGRIHNVELHCTVFILFFYHARDNLNNFSDIFYCIVLKDMPQPSNSGTTGVSGFFFFFFLESLLLLLGCFTKPCYDGLCLILSDLFMPCSWIFSVPPLVYEGKWRTNGSERRGGGRYRGRKYGGVENKMIKGTSQTTLLAPGYYSLIK